MLADFAGVRVIVDERMPADRWLVTSNPAATVRAFTDWARAAAVVGVDLAAGDDLTAVQMRDMQVRISARQRQLEEELLTCYAGHIPPPPPPPAWNPNLYAAIERSFELLRSWLTPVQLEQFERDRSFDVAGSHSGRIYRILAHPSYNVMWTASAHLGVRLCFQVPNVPLGDELLAQKLTLENDEPAALRVANTALYDLGEKDPEMHSLFAIALRRFEVDVHLARRSAPPRDGGVRMFSMRLGL